MKKHVVIILRILFLMLCRLMNHLMTCLWLIHFDGRKCGETSVIIRVPHELQTSALRIDPMNWILISHRKVINFSSPDRYEISGLWMAPLGASEATENEQ